MKLAPRWSEPGEVLEVLTNGKTYRVRRANGSIETVNVARLLPVMGMHGKRRVNKFRTILVPKTVVTWRLRTLLAGKMQSEKELISEYNSDY